MTAINATAANVALPSVVLDLQFSKASSVWVINAYMATFGGCMLLGGRLGDHFGRRRIFLLGVAFLSVASLACGLAASAGQFVAARAAQGLGAAIVSAVALSQVTHLFEEEPQRAKAMGVYIFVTATGGIMGVLLSGLLVSALSWRWVFLSHAPLGACICLIGAALLPHDTSAPNSKPVDIAGAITITTSLMLAIYTIVNATKAGWVSAQTVSMLVGACGLLVLFACIESRAPLPLIPFHLFQARNLLTTSIGGVLFAAAMLGWSFTSALHLQLVLQLSPLQVALTLLPVSLTIAMMSLVVSPSLVIRFGLRRPLVLGMIIAGIGLALLAQAPMRASIALDVLPGMLLVGLGIGMAYNPMLLGAVSAVAPSSSGAASGLVNTSLAMGGALGLSCIASVAAARTDHLLALGLGPRFALSSGYQIAYIVAATCMILAAWVCGTHLTDQHQLYDAKGSIERS